ncbi:hypothetical protein WAX46_07910 [Bacillus sp. FJAT-53060]|nr:hypothetical protein [Bacillus stratosphericus]
MRGLASTLSLIQQALAGGNKHRDDVPDSYYTGNFEEVQDLIEKELIVF